MLTFGPSDVAAEQTVDPVVRQSMAAIPYFGAAVFDNVSDMTAGWACRAGGKPFRFNAVSDLSNDTIWACHLDFKVYHAGARRLSHLRSLLYLRSSLKAVSDDLGHRLVGDYVEETVVLLANVVRQASLIAIHCYGVESPMHDLKDDLSANIRNWLPPAPKAPEETRDELLSAWQKTSQPDWSQFPFLRGNSIQLKLNRMDYARQIMATMVPDGAWTFLPPEEASKLTLDQLLDPTRPCLVEAAVELSNIDPAIASLIAFGAAASGKGKGSLRKWISQPELRWLTRHARVRISSVLFCRAAVPLPASVQLPDALTRDPLFSLSLSAGLVAESHWNALADLTYNRSAKRDEVTSWAVWLRAADRALCFELALKAHRAGFRVNGYSNGTVTVSVEREQMQDLLRFAIDNQIAHPAFKPLLHQYGVANEADRNR